MIRVMVMVMVMVMVIMMVLMIVKLMVRAGDMGSNTSIFDGPRGNWGPQKGPRRP